MKCSHRLIDRCNYYLLKDSCLISDIDFIRVQSLLFQTYLPKNFSEICSECHILYRSNPSLFHRLKSLEFCSSINLLNEVSTCDSPSSYILQFQLFFLFKVNCKTKVKKNKKRIKF